MQEEVENRTLTLVVSGTKFTGRMFKAAISKYMAHRKEKKLEKQRSRDAPVVPHGKQTVKGISESNQAAIFRRFYREEEVHEQQGVGIGLYLAREIVTRQGGYIKVVSEPGKGSEFSIMLPTK